MRDKQRESKRKREKQFFKNFNILMNLLEEHTQVLHMSHKHLPHAINNNKIIILQSLNIAI
jgi:hypothetical protein